MNSLSGKAIALDNYSSKTNDADNLISKAKGGQNTANSAWSFSQNNYELLAVLMENLNNNQARQFNSNANWRRVPGEHV